MFRNEDTKIHWNKFFNKTFIREHNWKSSYIQDFHILELLDEVRLTKTVVHVPSIVKKIVLEFYANLSTDMGDVTSENTYLAYVRRHLFAFSPH